MTTLIDALLRQQVYYEMWKAWEAQTAEQKVSSVIAAIIAVLVAKMPKEDFKQVTWTEVQALVVHVTKEAKIKLDKTQREVEGLIKEALVTVTAVTLNNYNRTTGTELGRKRMEGSRADRVAEVMKQPAAGTGLSPPEMLRDFGATVVKQTRALIMRAYAEKWTLQQLINAIRGTSRNGWNDGIMGRLRRQFGTVVRTLMQHVQAWVDYNIGRLFHDFYQWCSTLDSRTTEICRSRHRKVYRYGQGPIPPAHYNCRSRIMGVAADMGNQMPNAFYDWLLTQPDAFLADVLLPDEYQRVRNGTARRADHTAYTNRRTATRATFERRASIGVD